MTLRQKEESINTDFSFCVLLFYYLTTLITHFIFSFIFAFLFVPSVDTAVMVTVFPFPAFLVFTLPDLVTVAYLVLELVHFKVLLTLFPVVLMVVFNFMDLPAVIYTYILPLIQHLSLKC